MALNILENLKEQKANKQTNKFWFEIYLYLTVKPARSLIPGAF